MFTSKIDGATGAVNTVTFGAQTPVVCETTNAYRAAIPEAEAHVRALARQADRWRVFATERSRMTERTVTSKAFDALAFSVHHGAQSFAVPSKLAGTRDHQRQLWALVRQGYRPWERLALDTATTDGIAVTLDEEPLGSIQTKHVPWARPLIAFGLTAHLSRVTGHEREAYTLGVNIVLGGVGEALGRLLDALGAPGGGHSGDGHLDALSAPVLAAPARSTPEPSASTGAQQEAARGAMRLVVRPEREALDAAPDDVILWRRVGGTACASVPHVVRHSPTGIEWGYVGSGPADLARSVLLALTDEATADRLYQRFKSECIARLSFVGGVLRAAEVRAWVAAQQEAPAV